MWPERSTPKTKCRASIQTVVALQQTTQAVATHSLCTHTHLVRTVAMSARNLPIVQEGQPISLSSQGRGLTCLARHCGTKDGSSREGLAPHLLPSCLTGLTGGQGLEVCRPAVAAFASAPAKMGQTLLSMLLLAIEQTTAAAE